MANILVVDDSRTSRKVLTKILEDDGHTIVGEAANGEEGVALYKKLNPDLVTMDITMPVMDGIEALKQIMEENPKAKIVMVTAAGQKSKIIESVKYGASEFLSKPFEPEQITSILANIL